MSDIKWVEGISDEERWKALADWLRKPGSIDDDAKLADKLDPPKRKRTVWVNVYRVPHTGELYAMTPWETRELADKGADPGRVGCVRVELEEGRFDE